MSSAIFGFDPNNVDQYARPTRVAKAFRFPIYDPAEEPYVHDPYLRTLTQAECEADDSPYLLNVNAGQLVMKFNHRAGGTCHWISITGNNDPNDNIGGWGFGKGVGNSAMHVKRFPGYNPQSAGFSDQTGVETQMTEIVSGPGKGFVSRKFKVPLNCSTVTGNFCRYADLVALRPAFRLDDSAYPEVRYLEQHQLLTQGGGLGPGDFVDEDLEGWTQIDEATSEFSGSWHWAKWEKQAGIAAIRGRWYFAYERFPRAIRQFTSDENRASPKMSTSVRGASGGYDCTGIHIGSGFRTIERLYPRDVDNPADEIIFTHYALDVDRANGNIQLKPMPDFGPVEREGIAYYSWSELMQDAVSRDITGESYLPNRNRDPQHPDYLPNGTGGPESIALTLVASSDDPDDDRALGFYTPRSAMNRMPIEGWNRVTRKLVYRDCRLLEKSGAVLRDGNLQRHGTHQHHQTRISGMFAPKADGEWKDIVEVLHQDRIWLRGSPNAIRDACRRMESEFRFEEDMINPGDVVPTV